MLPETALDHGPRRAGWRHVPGVRWIVGRGGFVRLRSLRHEVYSRFLLQACDAILTADPRLSPAEIARTHPASNYRRMHSAVRAVHAVAPSGVDWLKRCLLRPRLLPLAGRTDMLGFGSGSTVYRLRPAEATGRRDLVVKVYRKALGRPLPVLLREALALRERHRMVCDWYAEAAIALPVEYVVLHGPLLEQPAVAGIQAYVDGERWDLFDLVRDGRFAVLLEEHPALEAQFRCFTERTVEVMDRERRCLDLIGRDNVLVVRTDDGHLALRVIDFGVIDLERERTRRPHRVAAGVERVRCLQRLHAELYGGRPMGAGAGKEA